MNTTDKYYINDNIWDCRKPQVTKLQIRHKLIKIQGGDNCLYCNTPLTDEIRTIDHKIPISRGGNGHIDNLALCCFKCNHTKGSKTIDEFIPDNFGLLIVSKEVAESLTKQFKV